MTSWLLPLPVAVPLIAAALIAASDHVAPRVVQDAIGIVAAALATAFSLVILVDTQQHDLVHWFSGWNPDHGIAIGVGFVADPLGAGMAALACGLTLLALIYSLTYMREAARLFNVLMLVFCGAMAGFALTGDLFNMFVWFELMGVAAYALAGFKIEELGPIQGAINFAISNTFGAYLILLGIGLLYAHTGALNLAQIGHTLAPGKPDGLTIVALTLLAVGFLVKAAVVPFHFWLADAHAAAPAPVCVLFSGAMVEIGILAIARLYWTIFDSPFGPQQAEIKSTLVWLGLVTALVGALMAFLQSHLKRMLAYSTISHAGAMLVGIGLLNTKALAGTANLVLSHGLLKGGLFLLCGAVLLRFRDIEELRLYGAGRAIPVTGVLWGLGTLGLIGVPYIGTFLGHSLIEDGATVVGIEWAQPLLMIASGVAAAAMLRAGARVFLGWGTRDDPLLSVQKPEDPNERTGNMPLMIAVASVAILLGLVVSVIPGLHSRSEHAAERFRDRAAYTQLVLHAKPMKETPRLPFSIPMATAPSWAYGFGSLAIAVAGAAFGLWHVRLPRRVRERGGLLFDPPLQALRNAHSGIVGDYLLWIALGTAVLGGVWAVALR